jgi:hypothetical protein
MLWEYMSYLMCKVEIWKNRECYPTKKMKELDNPSGTSMGKVTVEELIQLVKYTPS